MLWTSDSMLWSKSCQKDTWQNFKQQSNGLFYQRELFGFSCCDLQGLCSFLSDYQDYRDIVLQEM